MDGEGSKSSDEIRIAKWVVGGVIPSMLDFTPPQLDFAAASYAMEEERTEQGWFAMEESRWSRGDAPWRGGGLLCAPPPEMWPARRDSACSGRR